MTNRKRLALTLSLTAAFFAGSMAAPAPAADAATLSGTECRETLRGVPSGNDNEVAIGRPAGTIYWYYASVTRNTPNSIDATIAYRLYSYDGPLRYRRAWCRDWNHSGQLSSSEDGLF